MRIRRVLGTLLSVYVLSGCGGKDGPRGPNVAATCALANDGKQVDVIGFLATPMMVDGCGATCAVNLAEVPEYTNHNIVMQVPVGTGPLSIKALPTDLAFLQEIGPEAFTVIDSDGKPQVVGTRLRVTGKLEAKKMLIDPLNGSPKIEALRCTLHPTTIRPF